MAVPIGVGLDPQTLQIGTPVPLFKTRLAGGGGIPGGSQSKAQYAVASDRFLMNLGVEATASPIIVVLNWDAPLRK